MTTAILDPRRGAAGEPAQADGNSIPVFRQYLRIALRWRWVIAAAILGCGLIGLIITLLMTPQFTAATTIEISRESNKITDVRGGAEQDVGLADQEFYQTQYGLLRSRTLAERVASDLRLVDSVAFFEAFEAEGKSPAFRKVNGRYGSAGRAERIKAAGQVLLDHVDIAPARLSRLVDIHVTSPDPAMSARIANTWATSFIQLTLERRFDATSYARNFLASRLDQLRLKLAESERQLVTYAADQRIINLPAAGGSEQGGRTVERSIIADDLSTLNAALGQATADRIQAQARFEQTGRNGSSTEALRNVAINSLRQKRAELSAEYQRLLTQFEPEYPSARAIKSQLDQLDTNIARETGRVDGSLGGEYRQALQRERDLTSRVDTLKSGFLDQRRRSIQYNIYQREVDTNRELYNDYLQRFKEVDNAGRIGVNNVAIVDRAEVPDRRSSPRLFLNLLLSLIAGTVLGAALAFGLEQIDEAISDPGELQRQLNLPLLGSVPLLVGRTPIEALHDRKSELVDAYLAIQTNLQFTTAHGVPRSLAVTSTRPAEGKSTTSLALATMLARAKTRVVLVDGDMRSPSVHHLAGVRHDYGLSNFLAGSDDIDQLLVEMGDLGVTAMTAGPIPPNAAELLTGNRLSILIERLLERFDHVVIDSPPVMGLADAPLIASRVEATVYAVESHGIRASLVRTALSRLAAANAHVVGGVLTKFEARKAHFAYGYEYGYGYGRDAAAKAKVERGG